MSEVKGFKVFNPDWTCRGKQYTCPGEFEEDGKIGVCNSGMHFCKKAVDCFNYYFFDSKNKVAEVIAYGDVVEEGDKCCTNKLKIIREIPWSELLTIVNTGDYNSGNHNSGDYNSGHYNSGNHNSGNHNSGNCNSGNHNNGHYNSGHYNSGDYNSGDFNKTNFSNGCFNTKEQKICFFNKPSSWNYEDWLESAALEILNNFPLAVEHILPGDMTEKEIKEHPESKTTGGYLKTTNNSERANNWWRGLSDKEKETIKALPNFDKEIFKEITGIDVE